MIRFPNPGSDIQAIINIYKELYSQLKNQIFTLDDMSKVLTSKNLAASSGYVGEKALKLSTRSDRSKDPLYNQSKMYAELFRILGWVASDDENTALEFSFTFFGMHAANKDVDPKTIFEESILGINIPNNILADKSNVHSRVFSTILRVAVRLSGLICRDEIILGILSKNDIYENSIDEIANYILSLRSNKLNLKSELQKQSIKDRIQINTMQNYTRFPLSVLTFCDWFTVENNRDIYKNRKPVVFYKITPYGLKRVKELEIMFDVRLSYYNDQPPDKQEALIRLGFYSLLQRANFDISSEKSKISKDQDTLKNDIDDKNILFSPYQTIRPEIADNALDYNKEINNVIYNDVLSPSGTYTTDNNKEQVTNIKLIQLKNIHISNNNRSPLELSIIELIKKSYTDQKISQIFYDDYINSTQEKFYPLVADLFCILGFSCHTPQAGNNYERWDAIAKDEKFSVPIEIKSPTEELHISIKAIRQALENKIVLYSRKIYITDLKTVTLAVGYNPPNERAEIFRLISDVKNAFNINIGVIDFKSLVMLVCDKIKNNNNYVDVIRNMEGLINVENI